MCTAISYRGGTHYFGRTLDLEYGYHETVTVTPRRFPLTFRLAGKMETHHAIIGISAGEPRDYPLYYDGANEHGLAMAALNFPNYANYPSAGEAAGDRIAPFELILWVLGQCADADEAETLLQHCTVVNLPFSDALPLTPLHWMIADRLRSLVVESTAEGMRVFRNPMDVMTNSPDFPAQLGHLQSFRALSAQEPPCRFPGQDRLPGVGRGLGAVGLPGDWSSPSRFVRAAFALGNAPRDIDEFTALEDFFRIADCVSVPRGCVRVEDEDVITRYTACADTARGLYYWTTGRNRQIQCVSLHRAAPAGDQLRRFPLYTPRQIRHHN